MNEVLSQLQLLCSLQDQKYAQHSHGLFPAQRQWASGLYQRNDDTAFFTACVGFTIKRYLHLMSLQEQKLAKQLLDNMHGAFELFRNKDGHASYNFWQTRPSKHFPGGFFAQHFSFFMIPDDIDDSALIHLVKPHTEEERISFKKKMVRYAVGNLKWPDRPIKGYEELKPYNTFFVKNMPSAFDICALCNALYFVDYFNLQQDEQDLHSLQVIIRCVTNQDYRHRTFQLSPYYPDEVLILYHVIRYYVDRNIALLKPFHQQLLERCLHKLSQPKLNEMSKLLLHICVQKLKPAIIKIEKPNKAQMSSYPFFVAGILGEVKPKFLRALAHFKLTHITYHCLAYAEVLWLEHLLLNRALDQSISSS